MGCENQNCDNCECEPESTDRPELESFEPTPVKEVVYVERHEEGGVSFWSFFWGMALGTLFFGC